VGEGNYQDQLRQELNPHVSRGGDDGRRHAAGLHLVAALSPIALPLVAVVMYFARKDSRPLVRLSAAAILRFETQKLILLVGGVGLALVTHHDTTGGVLALVWLAASILLPLLAAARTWRNGRVFRYPVWDLLRPPSTPRPTGA